MRADLAVGDLGGPAGEPSALGSAPLARLVPEFGAETFDIGGGDLPATTGTTGTLAPGQTVSGEVAANGDRDFYRVTLTAGQTYTFTLTGSGATPLSDPYLLIYSSNGTTE